MRLDAGILIKLRAKIDDTSMMLKDIYENWWLYDFHVDLSFNSTSAITFVPGPMRFVQGNKAEMTLKEYLCCRLKLLLLFYVYILS